MTKLYYTNALHAAIMAQDHGVKFVDKDGDEIILWDNIAKGMFMWAYPAAEGEEVCYYSGEIVKKEDGRYTENTLYCVHPDSYYIFKPEDGDMDIDGDILYDNPKQKIGESCISDGEGGFKKGIWCVSKDYKANIIRRNNTAFFMPKQEQEDD